ncbi:MAG: nucleotidyltransferase domain-containing protein [Candidatus Heimdallarchaeota archaeon]|nr:nucleotidyltransferase domain-containing protein [Candidatus Heimdallarchaeota archaeon]
METSPLLESLLELRNHDSIQFAYLFGSQKGGKTDSQSDVDVAVFLNRNIKDPELFRIRLEIIADIADLLGRDDIDLVILNEDNTTINHAIIENGLLIFERNMIDRIDWETEIFSKWIDWKILMDVWRDGFAWQMERGQMWQ